MTKREECEFLTQQHSEVLGVAVQQTGSGRELIEDVFQGGIINNREKNTRSKG
jgi:hypothetical protein